MSGLKKRPRKSLRTILVVWFLLFTIIPLGFVSYYSLRQFERAIDKELAQRLGANAREISSVINDYRIGQLQKKEKYTKDPNLIYHLTMDDAAAIKNLSLSWIKQDFASSITFFNREGRLQVSVFKDDKNIVRSFIPTQEAIFLSAGYMNQLKTADDVGVVEHSPNKKTSLILISKVTNNNNKIIGYLEQIIEIEKSFLSRLKNRTKLEIIIFKDDGTVTVGTHADFLLYKKDFFKRYFNQKGDSFFELTLRGKPLGFLIQPVAWGDSNFFVALGASKSDAQAALKNIYYAFLSVVGAVILFLVITILVTSNWFLKPIYELVEALQSFESQEQAVTIPVKNDTEVGLLTESFNDMSKKIWQARSDLRKKITELELANRELKDTQTKLVHSAKMVSLGQLVAGVAHELNNPIGFINSNMAHLKDYSERLIQLVQIAEKNPAALLKAKEDLEFDYVVKDLPKLITSCQEGARRTRDIVIGLRNFSRLDAAKLQEIDLHQSLDTTLNLLQGEIKNRITVHKQYEPIPTIHCYATQINQVLMNILSNAVQAIEGSGQIWISTQTIKDKKGLVQVSIQDSGKGMAPDVLEKIFDPFFTTKGVGQGTGLGLSISYGIIQNHGGEIQVRSEVGVGTEFLITLPMDPPTQQSHS
ncbi:MAG: ATP-binding protein [Bdellovibrionia bacterium]